jgi:hypothetical protein
MGRRERRKSVLQQSNEGRGRREVGGGEDKDPQEKLVI